MDQPYFEIVEEKFLKHSREIDTLLPYHATENSAGYDFYSKDTLVLYPNEKHRFWFDIKAYMPNFMFLLLFPRNSTGNKGLRLVNTAGVIDADYYNSEETGGNINAYIENTSNKLIEIKAGERIVQGLFVPFFRAKPGTYSFNPENYVRKGGEGSSGK